MVRWLEQLFVYCSHHILKGLETAGHSWVTTCQHLQEPDLFQGIRLLWLRFESPQGMALARTTGGDAARGEAIAIRLMMGAQIARGFLHG